MVSPHHTMISVTGEFWNIRAGSFWSEWSYVNMKFGVNVNISRKVFPGEFQDIDAVQLRCASAHQALLKTNPVI